MKKLIIVLALFITVGCGREGASPTEIAGGASPSPPRVMASPAGTGASRSPTASATPAPVSTARAGQPSRTAAAAATAHPVSLGSSLVRPKVGGYEFHEKGTMRAGSAGSDQPFERDGRLTVSASGARTTLHFETDQATEEMTLRYEQPRAYLERARLAQSFAAFDATFDPPQLILRAPLRAGEQWTNAWRSGGTSGTTTIKVAREEVVRAFGKVQRAFVLVNTTDASGDAKGTTTSTSWYVPDLGLDVRRISDFNGSYRGIAVKQHSERMLTTSP